jgi:hypothetical protein
VLAYRDTAYCVTALTLLDPQMVRNSLLQWMTPSLASEKLGTPSIYELCPHGLQTVDLDYPDAPYLFDLLRGTHENTM